MGRSVGRSREVDLAIAQVVAQPKVFSLSEETGLYLVEAWRGRRRGCAPQKGSILLWKDIARNTIVDEGLNHKRSVIFLSGTQITAWYVLLTDGTPTIANGDTYASHAGWVEVEDYTEATREVWTGATTATAGEATNAASRAEFTIDTADTVVGGVAMVGGGSAPSTKGDTAGGGTLMSVAAFSGGDRTLQIDDLLRVTYIQRSQRP